VKSERPTRQIRPLADLLAAIPTLAEWFCAEWQAFDGRSCAEIAAQLQDNLNRDSLPITFVAVEAAEVIGTVSLDLADLPPYDHLSPWLASLYVVPPRRRAGVGRLLVNHAAEFVRQRGLSPLYLWTPGSTRMYADCGWEAMESATYAGRPITIMRRALG
jgi:GNAT superfamily N-acetyltransferase